MSSVYEKIRGYTSSDRDKTGLEENPEQAEQQQQDFIDEGELISYVDEEFTRRQKERLPFENQWKLNINFIEGNQYVDINSVSQALEELPKVFDWQEREVFNLSAPNIETRLARLSRMRPILKVRPGSNDPEDARATQVGNSLLKNVYYDKKMQEKQADVNSWLESTGTCLMKHTWNAKLGDLVGNDEETGQEIHEGDLDLVVCPPQEIFPDSCYHQDVDQCLSIIHAKAYHISKVAETWGKEVQPEQVAVMQLERSLVGTGGLGYNSMTHNYTTVTMVDYVLVKELWEMPSKDHPQGRMIAVANGVLLKYMDALPYKIGEDGKPALPFTKTVCIKRPGCFWGKSVISRMIPLQRRYNAVRNRKAEFLNRAAIGQWTVESDTVDLAYMEESGGSPGAIIVHTRGSSPPVPVQQASLPNEFETEVALLLQEFSIISGVSEISRQSDLPSSVKSGVAMQLALDQDDTRLTTTAANISNSLVDAGKIWLRLFKQYAQGPRVLRSIGKNNIVEMYDWSAADIKSDDVMIEPYSAITESPAQRRQMIFDLMETGLLTEGTFSKEVRSKILEMIDIGNWESVNDNDELHISKAERENLSMKQGIMAVPVQYDDHMLHVYYHNQFRLTVEYEQLIADNPLIADMFNDHIMVHMMGLQEIAMQQAASAHPEEEPAQEAS
jgi:hypothetical protein